MKFERGWFISANWAHLKIVSVAKSLPRWICLSPISVPIEILYTYLVLDSFEVAPPAMIAELGLSLHSENALSGFGKFQSALKVYISLILNS